MGFNGFAFSGLEPLAMRSESVFARLALARDPMEEASLGHVFAGVPTDLGIPSAAGFRVIVEGRRRELRASLRNEIYRIGREAIANAYRHSRATHIEMVIEYRASELHIVLRDNGCGINPRELRRNTQRGLREMRAGAERIGARLRILSRVALGTEVELCVPGRIAFAQRGVHAAC
jgi:nitrate/nitrite-specific signal transduction histidine kinase